MGRDSSTAHVVQRSPAKLFAPDGPCSGESFFGFLRDDDARRWKKALWGLAFFLVLALDNARRLVAAMLPNKARREGAQAGKALRCGAFSAFVNKRRNQPK